MGNPHYWHRSEIELDKEAWDNFIVDCKKVFYDKKDDNLFKITKHCRKCKETLPISHYFTEEALICKKCQLARIKKIIK